MFILLVIGVSMIVVGLSFPVIKAVTHTGGSAGSIRKILVIPWNFKSLLPDKNITGNTNTKI